MNTPELLRMAAEAREEYAFHIGANKPPNAEATRTQEVLLAEADTLRKAAQIAEGDLSPLYGLLPTWRWTDEMHAQLGQEEK